MLLTLCWGQVKIVQAMFCRGLLICCMLVLQWKWALHCPLLLTSAHCSNSCPTMLAEHNWCPGWAGGSCEGRAGVRCHLQSEHFFSVFLLSILSWCSTLQPSPLVLKVSLALGAAAAFSGWENLHVCHLANEYQAVSMLAFKPALLKKLTVSANRRGGLEGLRAAKFTAGLCFHFWQ